MHFGTKITDLKYSVSVFLHTLTGLAILILGLRLPAFAQDCPPKALPYYEDFDNDEWTFFSQLAPFVVDNCWRENGDNFYACIANSQDALFPDNPPGNCACCGSSYKWPNTYSGGTYEGYVMLLISPELESPPSSISFSIFSYGLYAPSYAGDSVRKRLVVGYIADTNDWKGSFVGVDTVELTRERLTWERFTLAGFEDMPAPYFVAFYNDTLLQYPAWPLPQFSVYTTNPVAIDYRFYIDSILFDKVPVNPDPDPDPDPGTEDPPVTPVPDTLTSVQLYLPNAFTPGGNQLNPEFRPVFSDPGEIEYYRMMIYNRWGNLIFRTEDLTHGWDGNHCPEGVYMTLVCYKPRGGKERTARGSVTLIR